jgi:outer membrane receptor protein involved in Fe transport
LGEFFNSLLGAVGNFTHVAAAEALTGISPTSYNATLYYESARWGVRGSLNYRSRYYNSRDPTSVISAGTQGYEATTFVDAAAFYNITKTIQASFDAINLTNQKETEFFGQPRYLYTQTQSGTTYMVGLSAKF